MNKTYKYLDELNDFLHELKKRGGKIISLFLGVEVEQLDYLQIIGVTLSLGNKVNRMNYLVM